MRLLELGDDEDEMALVANELSSEEEDMAEHAQKKMKMAEHVEKNGEEVSRWDFLPYEIQQKIQWEADRMYVAWRLAEPVESFYLGGRNIRWYNANFGFSTWLRINGAFDPVICSTTITRERPIVTVK